MINNTQEKQFLKGKLLKMLAYSLVVAALLICLDYMNTPSLVLATDTKFRFILICIGLVFVGVVIIKNISILKYRIINGYEEICGFIICSSILYFTILILLKMESFYKFVVLELLMLLSILVLTNFKAWNNNCIRKDNNTDKNVFSLEEVYNGKFRQSYYDGQIFISDKPSEIDLLNKEYVIDEIVDAVTANRSADAFCVGLLGPWGCGKTSLAKIAINEIASNSDIITIDDFELWKYGSNEAIVMAIYNRIIKAVGLMDSALQNKKRLESISNVTAGSKLGGIASFFSNYLDQESIIEQTKKEISDSLEIRNKQILFLIDDIDRSDARNIIFLLKLLGSTLNIGRITYLLLYEKSNLNKILMASDNIDEHYAEKIVQMEIEATSCSQERINEICTTVIGNILLTYGIKINDGLIIKIADIISHNCENLRSLIRRINSTIIHITSENVYIDKIDLLIIEMIRMDNRKLYNAIRDNNRFFISRDLSENETLYSVYLKKERFNKDCKAFFDNLFSTKENKNYIGLLSEIFPYVKRYVNNETILPDYSYNNDYESIIDKKSICSARYFELYFTYGSNYYLEIARYTDEMLNNIGKAKDLKTVIEIINRFIHIMKPAEQIRVLEQIELLYNRLDEKHYEWFSLALLENYRFFSDISGFLCLSARDRVVHILEKYVENKEVEYVEQIIKHISSKTINLPIMRAINIYCAKRFVGDSDKDKKRKIITAAYETMCNKILSRSINIYSKKHYCRRTTLSIYDYGRMRDNANLLKTYIYIVLDKNSIYRILSDIISVSISTKYRYYIDESMFNTCFEGFDRIDVVINEKKNRTSTEQIVYDIYQDYRNAILDNRYDEDECGLVTNEPIEFIL